MLSFFLFCSGANVAILKKHCSRGEQYKYAGIGAVVFFTAVMAALSASYALYTIFENQITSVSFGLLWGLMIFNLDRFILSTMKRKTKTEQEEMDYLSRLERPDEVTFSHNYKDLQGRKSSGGGIWAQAIPRLLLAVIIAIVISKPLEMKIFEKEIDQVLLEQKNDLRIQNKEQVGNLYLPEINALDYEISRLRNEIDHKETQANELYATFIAEAEGTAGTGLKGKGPVFREKKQKYDEILAELSVIRAANSSRVSELEQEKGELMAQYEAAVVQGEPVIDNVDGLMARIRALNELPQAPSLFIMLLFLCIETAPILAKLLAPAGQYERWLAKYEENDKIQWTLDTYRDRAFYQQKALQFQQLSTQGLRPEERSQLTSEFLRTYNKIKLDLQEETERHLDHIRKRNDDDDDDGNVLDHRIYPDDNGPTGTGRTLEEELADMPSVEEMDQLGQDIGAQLLKNQNIILNAHKDLSNRSDDEPGNENFSVDPFTFKMTDHGSPEGKEDLGNTINNFYRDMKNRQQFRTQSKIARNGNDSLA